MRKVIYALCAGLLLSTLSSCVEDPIVPEEPDCVDLGLSVKWARTNLGAESEENLGDYKNEYRLYSLAQSIKETEG